MPPGEKIFASTRGSSELLASEVHAWVTDHLDQQAGSLEALLREIDPGAAAWVDATRPPEERARWWRRQLIAAARSVDFYANLSGGAWWTRLQIDVLGERLRYLAAVQKVGPGESGVLALTVYAELLQPDGLTGPTPVVGEPEPVLDLTPSDSVTFAYTDGWAGRQDEVESVIRGTLRQAVERLFARFG